MNGTPAGGVPGPEPEARVIRLDGTPEQTADGLIADDLPEIFLDQLDLTSADGPKVFLDALIRRRFQASLERSEIIAFVERNRQALERTRFLDFVAELADRQAENDDEGIWAWIGGAIGQLKLVLDGQPERVDVVSSRLLWLCAALSFHVNAGRLSHAEAVGWLELPRNRERMTRQAVMYLLRDYLENIGDLESTRAGYLLLLAECALLSGILDCMGMAAVLLRHVPPGSDPAAWLATWRRLRGRLVAAGTWAAEDEAALDRTAARFDLRVSDDDF
jgi:hypothetical protein